jgi:hypothetical protein
MALKFYEQTKHHVRFWLLARMPTCQETVATISQSMERSLTLRERFELKIHLWICMWCQWYMEHLRLIHDAASVKADSPDLIQGPSLSDEARERIRRNLINSN